ncbi:bulb-type lectin domain-containing protein [Artemisia annua]|uniref:Bulb-type lectin domain-containing protein n=1 Tax=Artemisia annua TaxID=35608 RepID=A0A2U1Q9T4_ARTAN|nr:bulb-type lectin domain-containing protein [Artemisia annua]
MKMLPHIVIFLFFLFVKGASGATFTLVNECKLTVWPGITGTPGFNSTGFELMQNSSRSFQVTDSWDGVIWGRTDCTFNQFGQGSCVIGDCGSNEIECFGRESTSSVTNISFSLNKVTDETSYRFGYDVNWAREHSSRGYNELRMTVETTGGSGPCQIIGCPQRWCWKPIATNSRCQGADYTITFSPLPDTFSIVKLGSERNYTKYLISPDGDFTLGFFGANNSYLGIWYTYDDQSTKVWVANPNTPITSTSGRELVAEVSLANNLLSELTRYIEETRGRNPEIPRVHSLPLDQPINSYVLHMLLMTIEADVRVKTHLRAAREELLRNIAEKQEFISNLRAL